MTHKMIRGKRKPLLKWMTISVLVLVLGAGCANDEGSQSASENEHEENVENERLEESVDEGQETNQKANQGDPHQEINLDENDVVVSVEDEDFTQADVEFQRLIQQLEVEVNRTEDELNLDGDELEEALAYWEREEGRIEHVNHTLTAMIRTEAMAELGREKGYEFEQEDVEQQIQTFKEQYEAVPSAQELIEAYGADEFTERLEDYAQQWLLSMKVFDDLVQEVEEQNPDVNENEIYFLANEQYEELFLAQTEELQIEIAEFE